MREDVGRIVADAFERRAARAELLASGAAAASAACEPLRFAAGLYRAQGGLAQAAAALDLTGRLGDDKPGLDAPMRELLGFIARAAPPALAAEAQRRAEGDLGPTLEAFWHGNPDESWYLARALLRPYVEVLAKGGLRPDRPRSSPGQACPFCGGRPWIAARRSESADGGAERHLACALCGGEWLIQRILCPACGQDDPVRLPSFQSERHCGVRIEACERCHVYMKSIDLTVDARVIPEVDDLVSLAMDLWAAEQGFTRLEPGLAGV